MGILLKEAAQIFPFSFARLIAGADGIIRPVESAAIKEGPEISRWLKKDEIVFATEYAVKNVEDGCNLIGQLDQFGAAALVIKRGKFLNRVPAELIKLADQKGFPLFELPGNIPYMDCVIPILEHITEEQFWTLQHMETCLLYTSRCV